MNINQFVNNSHIAPALIHGVVDQVGGWESFQEIARDVSNYGADSGYSGFIYYSETVEFAEIYQGPIMRLVRDMADEFGTNWLDLIESFGCIDLQAHEIADILAGNDDDNKTQLFNALAWFALEEVSRAYVDFSGGE